MEIMKILRDNYLHDRVNSTSVVGCDATVPGVKVLIFLYYFQTLVKSNKITGTGK